LNCYARPARMMRSPRVLLLLVLAPIVFAELETSWRQWVTGEAWTKLATQVLAPSPRDHRPPSLETASAAAQRRNLFSIFDFFFGTTELPDLRGSWAQLVPGTGTDYYNDGVYKPEPRYAHASVPIPDAMRGQTSIQKLFLVGGWNGGASNELWRLQTGVINTTFPGTLVSGEQLKDPNDVCTENGVCNRWEELFPRVATQTCLDDFSSATNVSCNLTSTDLKGSSFEDVLRRVSTGATLLYKKPEVAEETGVLLLVSGIGVDTWEDDVWELDVPTTTWLRTTNAGAWELEQDQRLNTRSAVAAAASGSSYVDAFPPPRSDFTLVGLEDTVTYSTVVQATITFNVTVDTLTENEAANVPLDRDAKIRQVLVDCIVDCGGTEANDFNEEDVGTFIIPDSALYDCSKILPESTKVIDRRSDFVGFTRTDLDARDISPYLCMDPGCVITLSFFNNEAMRQQPMSNTSVRYSLSETRYGATFFTLNETFAGEIILNTSIHANSSTATVFNITWLRTDAVTDAYTRAVLYGGWNGSAYLDDVWEFTAAEQMTEFQWNQTLVEYVTIDNLELDPNYEADIHTDFPSSLPTRRRWRQITPDSETGALPEPRAGHASAVLGVPGGTGVNRYSLYVFGGRGDNGLLNDTWELSLEPYPPLRAEIQTISCQTSLPSIAFRLPYLDFKTGQWVQGDTTALLSPNSTLLTVARALETLPQIGSVTVVRQDLGRPSDQYQASVSAVAWTEHVQDMVDNALTLGNMSAWDQQLCQGPADANSFLVNFTITPPADADGNYTVTRQYGVMQVLDGTSIAINATVAQTVQAPGIAAYRWYRLADGVNASAPSVREMAAAAAVYNNLENDTMSMFVHGGWDGLAPLQDVWLLTPGDSPGEASWDPLPFYTDSGKWLSCRPNMYPSSVFGISCSNNSESVAPRRYGHTAVPIVTTTLTSNDRGYYSGMLLLFGVGKRRLSIGNNTNYAGWWSGGEEPDELVICHGPDDTYCGGVIKMSAAPAIAPPHVLSAFVVVAVVWLQGLGRTGGWRGFREGSAVG